MAVVFPIVMMLLFCSLYAGAYIWMRRPKFGESERTQRRATVSENAEVDSDAHFEKRVDISSDSKDS